MPDWRSYVRERLSLPSLRPEREAEIVEELAQQLEEAYRDALRWPPSPWRWPASGSMERPPTS